MRHIQQIAASLRKKENLLLVLDTLILFQMAFKTQGNMFSDKLIFLIFWGSMSLDPLEGSCLQRSLVPPPPFPKACCDPAHKTILPTRNVNGTFLLRSTPIPPWKHKYLLIFLTKILLSHIFDTCMSSAILLPLAAIKVVSKVYPASRHLSCPHVFLWDMRDLCSQCKKHKVICVLCQPRLL